MAPRSYRSEVTGSWDEPEFAFPSAVLRLFKGKWAYGEREPR